MSARVEAEFVASDVFRSGSRKIMVTEKGVHVAVPEDVSQLPSILMPGGIRTKAIDVEGEWVPLSSLRHVMDYTPRIRGNGAFI